MTMPRTLKNQHVSLIIQCVKIDRAAQVETIRRLLRRAPVVAILGARQVGKTTLAGDTRRSWTGPTMAFDLEDLPFEAQPVERDGLQRVSARMCQQAVHVEL